MLHTYSIPTVLRNTQVGFPRRSPEKLQLALTNTHVVLWVRATKQTRWARRGQLLGFARATSDHALLGTIWDVAVGVCTLMLPHCQPARVAAQLVCHDFTQMITTNLQCCCLNDACQRGEQAGMRID